MKIFILLLALYLNLVADVPKIVQILDLERESLGKELKSIATSCELYNDYEYRDLYHKAFYREKFENFFINNQDIFEKNLSPKLNFYISIMMDNEALVEKYTKEIKDINLYFCSSINNTIQYWYLSQILYIYKLKKSAEILLKHGLNPKKHLQDQIFQKAIEDRNITQIELLIKEGADIHGGMYNIPIVDGANETDILKLLIKNGADVNASYNNGETALIVAVQNKNYESAKLLLESGTEINPYYDGKYVTRHTPIQIAIYNKDEEMVALLQSYGADGTFYVYLQNIGNTFTNAIFRVGESLGFFFGMLYYFIEVSFTGEY